MNVAENKMRVFLDTNILYSAIFFPKSVTRKAFEEIIREHTAVICEYSLMELERLLKQTDEQKLVVWDQLISGVTFELAYTPRDTSGYHDHVPPIRDEKDFPILVSAYIADPDLLMTGDKDFQTKEIREIFTICTPTEFLQWFTQS